MELTDFFDGKMLTKSKLKYLVEWRKKKRKTKIVDVNLVP